MNAHDNTLGLIVLGGGVAAAGAFAWRGKDRRIGAADASNGVSPEHAGTGAHTAAWVHPVPSLGERPAVVSNPFRARASADGKSREHLGADLMYRRRDVRDLIAVFPADTAGGTPLFFMPEGISAHAASAGVVTFASATPVGNTVIVRVGEAPDAWRFSHVEGSIVPEGAVGDEQLVGEDGAFIEFPVAIGILQHSDEVRL